MYNQDMDEHKEKDTEINGALRSQGTSMLISKPLRLIEVEEDWGFVVLLSLKAHLIAFIIL